MALFRILMIGAAVDRLLGHWTGFGMSRRE
jgi:hypothetical protein